jgi:hypothetical protein
MGIPLVHADTDAHLAPENAHLPGSVPNEALALAYLIHGHASLPVLPLHRSDEPKEVTAVQHVPDC